MGSLWLPDIYDASSLSCIQSLCVFSHGKRRVLFFLLLYTTTTHGLYTQGMVVNFLSWLLWPSSIIVIICNKLLYEFLCEECIQYTCTNELGEHRVQHTIRVEMNETRIYLLIFSFIWEKTVSIIRIITYVVVVLCATTVAIASSTRP